MKTYLPDRQARTPVAENPIAFFNRISLVNTETGKGILPILYSDNYISLLPSGEKIITISYTPSVHDPEAVEVAGWNMEERVGR